MDYFPMRKEYPLEDQTRIDKDDEMFGRGGNSILETKEPKIHLPLSAKPSKQTRNNSCPFKKCYLNVCM